jgi:hypothetical protein
MLLGNPEREGPRGRLGSSRTTVSFSRSAVLYCRDRRKIKQRSAFFSKQLLPIIFISEIRKIRFKSHSHLLNGRCVVHKRVVTYSSKEMQICLKIRCRRYFRKTTGLLGSNEGGYINFLVAWNLRVSPASKPYYMKYSAVTFSNFSYTLARRGSVLWRKGASHHSVQRGWGFRKSVSSCCIFVSCLCDWLRCYDSVLFLS